MRKLIEHNAQCKNGTPLFVTHFQWNISWTTSISILRGCQSGGDFVHLCKFWQGGLCLGGILSGYLSEWFQWSMDLSDSEVRVSINPSMPMPGNGFSPCFPDCQSSSFITVHCPIYIQCIRAKIIIYDNLLSNPQNTKWIVKTRL